ncbi:unnamed protein product, partial [Prorocentrum cordatum]
ASYPLWVYAQDLILWSAATEATTAWGDSLAAAAAMPQQAAYPTSDPYVNTPDEQYMMEDFFGDSDTESDEDLQDPECTDEAIEAYASNLLPPGVPANRTNITTVLYETYLNIKKRYRAYTKKTTKVRRSNRRYYGRRSGQGKGGFRRQFGKPSHFPVEEQHDPTYFKGGKGKGSSFRGHGKNRKDPVTGEAMKCHECGSDEHLRRNCPKLHHLTHAAVLEWSQIVADGTGIPTDINTDHVTHQERQLRELMTRSFNPQQPQQAVAAEHQHTSILHQLRILDQTANDGEQISARFFPWWNLDVELDETSSFNMANLNDEQIFLLKTKLPGEGREGLLVDTGAHDNLVGNLFIKRVLNILSEQGMMDKVKWQKLPKPINVSGVGKESQLVEWAITIPLKVIANDVKSDTTYTAPVVGTEEDPSTIPALWGIKSMRHQRAVIDLVNNEIHLCGPGRVYINTPHGTSTLKIESSMSGHPLVPCTEFDKHKRKVTFKAEPQYATEHQSDVVHHFSDFIGKQHESGSLKTTMVRLQDGSHTSTIRLEANFDLGAPGMIDHAEAPAAVASLLDLLFKAEHKTTDNSSGDQVMFDVLDEDSTAYPTDAAVRAKERERHRKAQAIDPTHATPSKKKKFKVEQHFDDCGLDDSSLKQALWTLNQTSTEIYDDKDQLMDNEQDQDTCSVFVSSLRGLSGSDTNDKTYSHVPKQFKYDAFTSFMADWSYPAQYSSQSRDHYIDVVEICGGNARTSQILIHRFHETKIGLNFDIIVGIDLLDPTQEAALWQYLKSNKVLITILSVPCTGLAGWQTLNKFTNPETWKQS